MKNIIKGLILLWTCTDDDLSNLNQLANVTNFHNSVTYYCVQIFQILGYNNFSDFRIQQRTHHSPVTFVRFFSFRLANKEPTDMGSESSVILSLKFPSWVTLGDDSCVSWWTKLIYSYTEVVSWKFMSLSLISFLS